ncbi:ATP-binding cassette domain-containing protein [Oscillibacter sp.]|uniref:ABC transporter ATP-binding protein n=1 Tax=Oscillibacter sp. TaxID=1945593 RepID=UPI002899B3DC|nr:ATP-binding cassette domain-containing protein [Oscillibacter sp.]
MSNVMAVKTDNLIKTFSGMEVIKGCNIHVPKGCIYGLLGANGAGKTTIFKLLMGFLIPTAGEIEILSMDVMSSQNEILKNIGSIIEVPVFYEHLSASENLEIHLAYMDIVGDIPSILDMVGLKATNMQPVSKYSLGMRQRLGIARALVHKPKLLILDEPINGLDPMGIREMRELLIRLKDEQDMTIVISSHILSEMEHVADIVGIIVNGVVVEEITLSEVKKQFPNGLEDYFFNIMNGGAKLV